MSFIKTPLKQLFVRKKLLHYIYLAFIPAVVFYVLALVGLRQRGFNVMQILRDPAQQSGASSFLGFLSNIGIWLWISSAAICFFFAFHKRHFKNSKPIALLFLTGLLSLLLAVDDFFMIHDRYVDQNICYLVYAIILSTLFIKHYKTIIDIAGFAFLSAGLFLALSIFTDLIQDFIPLGYTKTQILEEGFKFLGAASWLYFNTRVGLAAVRSIED